MADTSTLLLEWRERVSRDARALRADRELRDAAPVAPPPNGYWRATLRALHYRVDKGGKGTHIWAYGETHDGDSLALRIDGYYPHAFLRLGVLDDAQLAAHTPRIVAFVDALLSLGWPLIGRGSGFNTFHEPLDLSGSIDDALLPGVERVADAAQINAKDWLSGSCFENTATGANDFGGGVIWMNIRFHYAYASPARSTRTDA